MPDETGSTDTEALDKTITHLYDGSLTAFESSADHWSLGERVESYNIAGLYHNRTQLQNIP